MTADEGLFVEAELSRSLAAMGVGAATELFAELAAKYGEEGRFYHSATHIAASLPWILTLVSNQPTQPT